MDGKANSKFNIRALNIFGILITTRKELERAISNQILKVEVSKECIKREFTKQD